MILNPQINFGILEIKPVAILINNRPLLKNSLPAKHFNFIPLQSFLTSQDTNYNNSFPSNKSQFSHNLDLLSTINNLIKNNPFTAIVFIEETDLHAINIQVKKLSDNLSNCEIAILIDDKSALEVKASAKEFEGFVTELGLKYHTFKTDLSSTQKLRSSLDLICARYFQRELKSVEKSFCGEKGDETLLGNTAEGDKELKQRVSARQKLFEMCLRSFYAEFSRDFNKSEVLWGKFYVCVFDYAFVMEEGERFKVMELAAVSILKQLNHARENKTKFIRLMGRFHKHLSKFKKMFGGDTPKDKNRPFFYIWVASQYEQLSFILRDSSFGEELALERVILHPGYFAFLTAKNVQKSALFDQTETQSFTKSRYCEAIKLLSATKFCAKLENFVAMKYVDFLWTKMDDKRGCRDLSEKLLCNADIRKNEFLRSSLRLMILNCVIDCKEYGENDIGTILKLLSEKEQTVSSEDKIKLQKNLVSLFLPIITRNHEYVINTSRILSFGLNVVPSVVSCGQESVCHLDFNSLLPNGIAYDKIDVHFNDTNCDFSVIPRTEDMLNQSFDHKRRILSCNRLLLENMSFSVPIASFCAGELIECQKIVVFLKNSPFSLSVVFPFSICGYGDKHQLKIRDQPHPELKFSSMGKAFAGEIFPIKINLLNPKFEINNLCLDLTLDLGTQIVELVAGENNVTHLVEKTGDRQHQLSLNEAPLKILSSDGVLLYLKNISPGRKKLGYKTQFVDSSKSLYSGHYSYETINSIKCEAVFNLITPKFDEKTDPKVLGREEIVGVLSINFENISDCDFVVERVWIELQSTIVTIHSSKENNALIEQMWDKTLKTREIVCDDIPVVFQHDQSFGRSLRLGKVITVLRKKTLESLSSWAKTFPVRHIFDEINVTAFLPEYSFSLKYPNVVATETMFPVVLTVWNRTSEEKTLQIVFPVPSFMMVCGLVNGEFSIGPRQIIPIMYEATVFAVGRNPLPDIEIRDKVTNKMVDAPEICGNLLYCVPKETSVFNE